MKKSLAAFSPVLRFLFRLSNLTRTLRFSTSISSHSPSDFIPSYLVTKCGFSADKAAKAAKLIPRRVLSPDQPDSVISFLKSHGFNDSHLKRLLSYYPQALALSVEKTLAPKFHTFHELGFTGNDLIVLVCSNPCLLARNMEENIVPKIKWWRSILGSHSLLMKCLTQYRWQIITASLHTTTQNITILQKCGLSDHQISAVVRWQPSIITKKQELLNELISRVESLGLPCGSPNFHWALFVLSMVSEDGLRAKMEFFKRFGWSEDDFSKAFRKSPSFFTSSCIILEEKMEFFVNEANCHASYIAHNPFLLSYSLEKRLIPRLKLLRALKEKGLKGGDHKLSSLICITKKKIFERYVAPYKESIPELSQLLEATS